MISAITNIEKVSYDNIFLKSESDITKNLYQVGTQNGNSKYNFTTIETAVTNSIVFANKIEPETCKNITKKNLITNLVNQNLMNLLCRGYKEFYKIGSQKMVKINFQ